MPLARYPGLRVLGHEPDEVEIEITVTGKRTREVVIALSRFVGNGEIIPFSIGLPGLDTITGGILTGTEVTASAHAMAEAMEITFTVQATQEREET